ncbi:MAG: hypothetical protein NT011_11570 [Kiritimatiellaeota bacterium]|nr:hypothetical protein [Kiritimatiellota bacterium]
MVYGSGLRAIMPLDLRLSHFDHRCILTAHWISDAALISISKRNDGIAEAVIEKYCDWAKSTSFLFSYSDLVCSRLTAIFDNGIAAHKAMAYAAMIKLAYNHNRWHIMREFLERSSSASLSEDMSQRLKIEIKAEELEPELRHCVDIIKWDVSKIATEIAKILS